MVIAWAACAEPAEPPPPVSVPAPAASPIAPETLPVATVDGAEIPLDAFNARYRARMGALGAAVRGHEAHTALQIKRQVLDGLIDEALIAAAARPRGIYGDPAAQLTALAGEGPPVSDDEVAAAYAQSASWGGPTLSASRWQHPAYLLANAIVMPADRAAELAALRERIVAEGLSFDQAARRHSIGPTAAAGGDLGQVTATASLDPAIRAAVDALAPGGISAVIALPDSDQVAIVRLRERVPAAAVPLADAAPILRGELADRRQRAREASVLAGLRADAAIDDAFAARTGDALAGTGPASHAGAGYATIADQLPEDVRASEHAAGAKP